MEGRMDGWMDGRKDGREDEWMDGWMEGGKKGGKEGKKEGGSRARMKRKGGWAMRWVCAFIRVFLHSLYFVFSVPIRHYMAIIQAGFYWSVGFDYASCSYGGSFFIAGGAAFGLCVACVVADGGKYLVG